MSKICHLLGDSKYGGGSKVVLGLCECVIADGHEAFILTTDTMLKEEIEKIGGTAVELDCIRRSVRPLWDLLGLFRLVRHLRNADYDLVHTHTSKAGMIGRFACRLAGVPSVVHTVHGFAFHEQSRPAIVSLISTFERLAASWCDRIVTVSWFHRSWALRLGISTEEKIVAIPNGIAGVSKVTDDQRREFRSRLGVADDEFLVLGLGRLAEQKGFGDLISAIPLVMEMTTCRIKVKIAGEGPKRKELEQIIDKLCLSDTVELIGFSRDVVGLFGAADLIVQPSLWEGLSISLLEAMSAGKAVVTTTIESNTEVVGDTKCAVLVPAKNPAALASAITALITNDEARRIMETRAYEVFKDGYTEQRMHDDYAILYSLLLMKTASIEKIE